MKQESKAKIMQNVNEWHIQSITSKLEFLHFQLKQSQQVFDSEEQFLEFYRKACRAVILQVVADQMLTGMGIGKVF